MARLLQRSRYDQRRNGVADLLVKRLLMMLAVTAIGAAVAWAFGFHDLHNSSAYLLTATTLLTVGLFSSTYEINRREVAGNVRLVLAAVTVGVLFKAAIITAVMLLVFRNPAYLVLAVAVAQIDPLSVAVTRGRSRLSPRAQAILSAWSSFDDPVTAILAVYLSTVALQLSGDSPAGTGIVGTLGGVGTTLALNLLLVAGLGLVWVVLRATGRMRGWSTSDLPIAVRVVAVLILLAASAIAVANLLVLGIAVAGLFYRPGVGAALRLVTPVAFFLALFMLGLVLAGGANWSAGLLLGFAAYGAHAIVSTLLTRSLHGDRARLAVSQQNGITAVILALLLETSIPGTVAIVAPAILVVGMLHLIANAVLNRIEDRVPRPVLDNRPAPLTQRTGTPSATGTDPRAIA